WLDSGSKTPFFIWIHYNDPHVPYKPPVPYNKLYVRDKFYNPDKKVNLVDNIYGWGGISPKANIEDIRELDYYIAQYDGEIRYTDFWIGRLMDYLKAKGFYDDSVIVISADHGEAFGEHNLYCEHANTLYDELIRVPLIIRFPGAAFKDKRVKRQVRSIDLMPTILNYSNLKIPQHLDGESLLPLLRLQGEYAARFSFSKTGLMAALRTEEWKLIYYEGEEGGVINYTI
ncbi:MAG: sulfatase-like hydrolase/transferase, partial [Candidatus Omnitrophica bacterium]|nr:sulfatase-like hydrolase/transferase [Candidatus Omnitrophota bacterium]